MKANLFAKLLRLGQRKRLKRSAPRQILVVEGLNVNALESRGPTTNEALNNYHPQNW